MNEDIIARTIREVLAEQGKELPQKAHECKHGHDHHGHGDHEGHHCSGSCGNHKQMTLQKAVALIERVEEKAKELDMRVVTAVSDGAGRPVAIHCMDGAYIGSFDVALNKTYTSVAFQMSTAKLGELAAPGQSLYGIQFTNEGKIVIFGGGEPLMAGDKLVGAVGVSGGTAEQDTNLALYAREVWDSICQQ